MNKVSRSPDRNTFQRNNYLKRCEEQGKEPSEAYLQWFDSIGNNDLLWETEQDHSHDMEYDLRSSNHLCAKVRASESYAQNLYAAMCNIRWQKREVLPILKDQYWSCTWRSSGGIVANMRGEGDYIDWYCSGIGEGLGNGDADGTKGYVPEGTVTEEIEMDLYALGWMHSEWPEDK